MNATERPQVLVLVDYAEPLLATGLAAALRTVDGLRVLAPSVEGTPTPTQPVDVLVTDQAGGIAWLARQRQGTAGPLAQARVLIVAAHDRETDVRMALEKGVQGYVLLGCTLQELAMAVLAVARGSKYLCMEVAQRAADSLTREALTSREAEVLGFLALGECNKAIARRLDIAVGTVKTHVRSIMCKLDAASRTHAVTIASRRGLVAPDQAEVLSHKPMPFLAGSVPARLNGRQYA